ncbi:MAG: GDSL-type esterase/lipase family protein [Acutalibacteraceae bacterium]|jgi:lysophospholipase L1-like esterase
MKQNRRKKALSAVLSLTLCICLATPALGGVVAAESPVRIACVGDSITWGAGASDRATYSYPAQLQKRMGSGYDVRNFGLGDRSMLSKAQFPYIKTDEYTQSKNFAPDYVIIMLGTNDSKPVNWAHKAEFESDMRAMIQSYRNLDSHPVVIVATTPTVGSSNAGITDAVVTGEIVPIQKRVAADMGCPVIDINALTRHRPTIYIEGIHPDNAGYALLTQMFYDGLQEIFNARLHSLSIGGVKAVIDEQAAAATLTLPHGTDLSALTPVVTLADGARIDKTGPQDFTVPVTYTVTSPDGKRQKAYAVTVTTAPADAADDAAPVAVTLNGVPGVIDEESGVVTVTLPASADVTAAAPAFTLPEGAAVVPTAPQNFTSPVTYTVTAANGAVTRSYVVKVERLRQIKVALVGDSMTAADNYPNALAENLGGDYLIGRFGVGSTTVQKSGKKETGDGRGWYGYHPQYQQSLEFQPDFVLLMLGANDSKQDGGNPDWVTNWTESSAVDFERDLSELVASYQALDSRPVVIIATSPSGFAAAGNWGAQPRIVNEQIAPLQRAVAEKMGCFLVDFNAFTKGNEYGWISGDGLHPNGSGYHQLAAQFYDALRQAQASIRGMTAAGEEGVVSHIDRSVGIAVPDETDLTALAPAYTLADGATIDVTGTRDYTDPVTVTVTSVNGVSRAYTVSAMPKSAVSVEKIALQTPPAKIEYLQGERLDLTGAALAVTYSNGMQKQVPVTDDMVEGYDWLTVGEQSLTVTCEGMTAAIPVRVMPHGVIGTFHPFEKEYSAAAGNWKYGYIMYADWTWADQRPIDLSGNRDGLYLTMTMTFRGADVSDCWDNIVVKLRSEELNGENNCGWTLTPASAEVSESAPGVFQIAIPLTKTPDNNTGTMDWATAGRIIALTTVKSPYRDAAGKNQLTQTLSGVYIVDRGQTPAPPDTAALQTAIGEADALDTAPYTDESVAAFDRTLALAKAYLTNPYASQESVDGMIDELRAAAAALETAPAYTAGDVDESGTVTAADALMALQAATGKIELTDAQTLAADVDGNPGVSASDALMILQFATGKIGAFSINA